MKDISKLSQKMLSVLKTEFGIEMEESTYDDKRKIRRNNI